MSKEKASVKLWIVGSIGIDDIKTRTADRKNLLGGSVPYSTVAASFFTKTGAVGVVGSDFPAAFDRRWQAFGIDLTGVQRQQGSTFRWACEYDDNMIERTTLKTELGVFASFMPELPAAYRTAPFVLLGNIQPELQMHVLKQADGAKFVALDTMNLWIETARPALLKVIRRVNLLTVNDGEARQLTGKWNLRECAEAILKMGPSYAVIKKGEHGALLFSKDGVFIVPAYPVRKLVDPTGAGDSYAGTFMGYLARAGRVSDGILRKALVHASAVASFGVEGFSLERFQKLSTPDIQVRVDELKSMVKV
ncbi:MAG: sugar kinase [Kiritimatiellae bacterium]|jgi:sugar/nucleoside kinase (ribokinase family)|nr:sugar kinase [Kiritimatiellia bacterium]MDD3584039.1 PfkB family carbohydrate kinase [Kiritimatiellia bacterium]HHU15884.1 sugar kinase [Lentisphaerota bacterium]HON46686.1 PfkB family carbohydrate kinase [Kiritimatiellia bacterium]